MINVPNVRINEVIEVGARSSPFSLSLRAVVCSINPEKDFLYDIEVVYLQEGYKAVKAEVIWDGEMWQFKDSSGMGVSLSESESYKFKDILKK
ncbi:MAG: hypothetical protein Q7K40_04760 [bacterium]|nr:hypothetical protein [bacterium]